MDIHDMEEKITEAAVTWAKLEANGHVSAKQVRDYAKEWFRETWDDAFFDYGGGDYEDSYLRWRLSESYSSEEMEEIDKLSDDKKYIKFLEALLPDYSYYHIYDEGRGKTPYRSDCSYSWAKGGALIGEGFFWKQAQEEEFAADWFDDDEEAFNKNWFLWDLEDEDMGFLTTPEEKKVMKEMRERIERGEPWKGDYFIMYNTSFREGAIRLRMHRYNPDTGWEVWDYKRTMPTENTVSLEYPGRDSHDPH